MLRILLTGGGTGGHIYPLVAVAGTIKKLQPEAALYFLGPLTIGTDELAKEGVAVYRLVTGKFRRYFDPRWLLDLLKLPVGLCQTLFLMFWLMPDVIFSKGGYGSVPVVLVGRLYRIPVVIHESDAVPGFANRILARFARSVLVAFPEVQGHFHGKNREKVFVVGNPVRHELLEGAAEDPKTTFSLHGGKPLIAALGGSQGAERLNDLVLLSLAELLKTYEIIHQTGANNLAHVKKEGGVLLSPELMQFWHPFGFFEPAELKALFSAAECIVSRAGAGAIFEIAAAGKPSILIPLDLGSRGEQIKNAYAYARSGAAIVLEEANLTAHLFVKTIQNLMQDHARREQLAQAAEKFATPDAAQRIAEAILASVES